MRPGGGQADDHVARTCATAVDDRVFFHDADAEARQVVIAGGIHAGHLRGLAADQRSARLDAALDDALDHRLRHVDAELAGRVVVEEEQRLRALHDHVVHAHRDQVDADRVVAAGLDRQPELGADAVGAGDQHRLAVAPHRNLEQRAEAAEAAEHFGAQRALDGGLDAFDQLVAGLDIDAGIFVGNRVGGHGDLK